MRSYSDVAAAVWPVVAGLLYFATCYALVEWQVVRRRVLTEYQLKVVDFAWLAASAIELTFLFLASRDTILTNRIADAERRSAAVRDQYISKIQTGTYDCMAGKWPAGAIGGKSYHENGDEVSDACAGVSFVLNYFQQFFNDDRLWRYSPSLETAARFEDTYRRVFFDDFDATMHRGWSSPRPIDRLTLEARTEFAGWAERVVAYKRKAGTAAYEDEVVRKVGEIGLYWPIVLATSLAFSIGKARLELRNARRRRGAQRNPA